MKKLLCTHCEKQTQRSHPILDISLCRSCEKVHPEIYRWITQSTALKDYRLTKHDLTALDCYQVPNPYYRSAAPMKLYLARQVEALGPARDGQDHSARNGRSHQGGIGHQNRRVLKAA